MTGRTNVGSGSCYAAIGAVFAPGVNCTCTDGITNLRALDLSGYAVFAIPRNGTWTVTCGNLSKSVTIDHKGQCEIVNVKRLYLFVPGSGENEVEWAYYGDDITLTFPGGNNIYWSGYYRSWAYVRQAQNIAGYSKYVLNFNLYRSTGREDLYQRIYNSGGSIVKSNQIHLDSHGDFSGSVELSLTDLEGVRYKFGWGNEINGGSSFVWDITEAYLE